MNIFIPTIISTIMIFLSYFIGYYSAKKIYNNKEHNCIIIEQNKKHLEFQEKMLEIIKDGIKDLDK